MSDLIIQDNNFMSRGEFDAKVSAAHARPRDITKSIEYATMLATIDEETAQSCIYALPRKDKSGNQVEVKGESIRLAEIMVSAWKNIVVGSRIKSNDGKNIITEGICYDLENNITISKEDTVSIIFGQSGGKPGYQANADMQTMLAKASQAKAMRNAIFAVIPKSIVKVVYKKAVTFAIGDVKTLSSKVDAAINKLVKMGVNKEAMMDYFGHSNLQAFSEEDYETIIGIGTALKSKSIKPEDLFTEEKAETESASDKLNQMLFAKAAPKLQSSVNANTGEVVESAYD
jgi:hypothetical protein